MLLEASRRGVPVAVDVGCVRSHVTDETWLAPTREAFLPAAVQAVRQSLTLADRARRRATVSSKYAHRYALATEQFRWVIDVLVPAESLSEPHS